MPKTCPLFYLELHYLPQEVLYCDAKVIINYICFLEFLDESISRGCSPLFDVLVTSYYDFVCKFRHYTAKEESDIILLALPRLWFYSFLNRRRNNRRSSHSIDLRLKLRGRFCLENFVNGIILLLYLSYPWSDSCFRDLTVDLKILVDVSLHIKTWL
jgi:hypothetical protein